MKSKNNTTIRKESANPVTDWLLWIALLWAGFVTYKVLAVSPLHIEVFFDLVPTQIIFPSLSVLGVYIKGILIWLGILCGSAAIGSVLLRWIHFAEDSALEFLVFSIACGCALTSFLILILVGLHWLYPLVLAGLWISGISGFIWLLQDSVLKSLFKQALQQTGSFLWSSEQSLIFRIFLWIFLFISFMMALVPELFYDSMVYHLGVPNLYLQERGFTRVNGVHSRFPLLWQMLYTYGLAFEDEIVPKLIHWSTGLWIVLACGSLSKRLGMPKVGFISALFFLSVPMVQMNIWTAGIDIGNCLFSFLAVYGLLAYLQLDEHLHPPPHPRPPVPLLAGSRVGAWIFLMAFMSGCAFGSKYQGGILAVTIFLVFTVFHILKYKNDFFEIIKGSALFITVISLSVLPWLIKNFLDTGNPLFPFLTSIFEKLNLQKIHLDPNQLQAMMGENRRFITSSWQDFWKLPWLITFKDTNQSSLSFPGPLFLILLPLSLLALKEIQKQWMQALVLFLFIFFTTGFSATHLTRYHLPGYPALCFFYAISTVQLWNQKRLILKLIFSCAFFVVMLENLQIGSYIISNSYRPWDVLTGRETRENYKTYSHPGLNPYPANAMYRWMENHLSRDSRTILIGDSKPYDLKLRHVYADVFGKNPVLLWSRSGSADQIYEEFKKAGITHILINIMEAYRTYGYQMINFSDSEMKVFEEFWNRHVRMVTQGQIPEKFFSNRSWIVLYEVLPKEEAQRKGMPPDNPIVQIRNLVTSSKQATSGTSVISGK